MQAEGTVVPYQLFASRFSSTRGSMKFAAFDERGLWSFDSGLVFPSRHAGGHRGDLRHSSPGWLFLLPNWRTSSTCRLRNRCCGWSNRIEITRGQAVSGLYL